MHDPADKGRGPRRALPGWAVDDITTGVGAQASPRAHDLAVSRVLLRTAMSAQANGWARVDWEALCLDEKRALAREIRLRRGKPQTAREVAKRLLQTWAEAVERREARPWDEDERARAVERDTARLREAAGDADAPLRPSERVVLLDVAAQMDKRQMTRVALPWREVVDRTGLGERAAKNALASLCDKGFLTLHRRGEPRREGRPARANLYRLGPSLVGVP